MNPSGKTLLLTGAALNFAVALLHLGIIAFGAPAYLYFGAADLAVLAQAGSPTPALVTVGLVMVFTVFAMYALSGAGVIRRLPLLILGLLGIGALYALRGLVVVPDVIGLARGEGYPFRQTVFSAVALVIGLVYLIGAARQWPFLRRPRVG